MKKEKCEFCKNEIMGYGNNAEPIKHSRCCDECDAMIVILGRIKLWLEEQSKNKIQKENASRWKIKKDL